MPSVTLYVDPAGVSMDVKNILGGEMATGRTCIKVQTRNKSFDNNAANSDIIELNAKLLYYCSLATALDPVYLVGHSRGAQIIYKWIREFGPTSTINPNTLRIYTVGCPEQRYTGAIYQYPAQEKASYPGNQFAHTAECPTPAQYHGGNGAGFGLPTSYTIPWKIWCIANQFDGWADAPNLWNQAPINQLTLTPLGLKRWYTPGDLFAALKTNKGNHSGDKYTTKLSDSKNVSFVPADQPNVTYVWIPKYPIPSAYSSKWLRFWARKLDEDDRPAWDACWTNRPVTIPPPDYANIPSWIDYS